MKFGVKKTMAGSIVAFLLLVVSGCDSDPMGPQPDPELLNGLVVDMSFQTPESEVSYALDEPFRIKGTVLVQPDLEVRGFRLALFQQSGSTGTERFTLDALKLVREGENSDEYSFEQSLTLPINLAPGEYTAQFSVSVVDGEGGRTSNKLITPIRLE